MGISITNKDKTYVGTVSLSGDNVEINQKQWHTIQQKLLEIQNETGLIVSISNFSINAEEKSPL